MGVKTPPSMETFSNLIGFFDKKIQEHPLIFFGYAPDEISRILGVATTQTSKDLKKILKKFRHTVWEPLLYAHPRQ